MNRKAITGVAILSLAAAFAGCSKGWQPQKAPALPPKNEADLLMGQIDAYLDNGDFINSDRALARLNELKPNLPAEYAAKIDATQKKIDTAKAKAPK